jgi:protein ImuA
VPARIETRSIVTELRRRIARIEGRPTAFAGILGAVPAIAVPAGKAPSPRVGRSAPAGGRLRTDLAEIDGLFALPGLPLGAIHQIRMPADAAAAALGFLAAIMACQLGASPGAVLWVTSRAAAQETGGLYAPGLAAFGLDPGRLVHVRSDRIEDGLWALEESLDCRGIAAVVGEFGDKGRRIDVTAGRRLGLRAQKAGIPVFLLTPTGTPACLAAATRWRVAPCPSASATYPLAPGRPAFRIARERNREGPTAAFDLEWMPDDRRFRLAAPDTRPRVAASSDRSPRPPAAGTVLALRRAS